MKGVERWKLFQCIQHYFNRFISTLFQQYYFNKYEFQRISTYLFQLISTIFQHLFQRIYRMKTVERRNLFQHYFNIFNPPGSLMQLLTGRRLGSRARFLRAHPVGGVDGSGRVVRPAGD
jgi:hypothetical protein